MTNRLGTGTLTLFDERNSQQRDGGGSGQPHRQWTGAIVVLNSGTLKRRRRQLLMAPVFTIGDGVDGAAFILDSGGSGFHSFANGMIISSNAVLKGSGAIVGNTVFNSGGVLAPGASPGSITFSNSPTLSPNSTFSVELEGAARQYDQIVALGSVSVSNSVLSLSLGYTPSIR